MYYVWCGTVEQTLKQRLDGRVSRVLIRHGLVASIGVSGWLKQKRVMYPCIRNTCLHSIHMGRCMAGPECTGTCTDHTHFGRAAHNAIDLNNWLIYAVFQISDAKIEITMTTTNLIGIKYPLNFNSRLSGAKVANFNKIHRTVSEQQLFTKWNSKTEVSNMEKSP